MLKRHREAMVKAITSNSANKFTEAELKKMGTDDLEKISALLGDAVPEVNYSGRGIHRVPALNVSEEAIPEPPSVFKLLQEKANGADAAAKERCGQRIRETHSLKGARNGEQADRSERAGGSEGASGGGDHHPRPLDRVERLQQGGGSRHGGRQRGGDGRDRGV